ncbi:type II toxin-antitoxin system RatA family toxin [Rhodobacteraceae bacterium 2CG4]|uniref:Type II toxin-antitoxin system RatA family toxin n=1 Tax=Halovulum marinum TaxID=2662447 RepID=A0A6L5YZF3_9RHOB|nr:type II toxin-antitoxin system RatA family toxin [Halovulum marinum]MSU89084.1 type II toxin-antitoxin system RatA family toxin [Halovulum marinum]
MPTHTEDREMPYSADQLYALVADIESYPEFLPWCSAARIRRRHPEGAREILDAELVISFKVFRERFGSRVTLDPEARRIAVEYLDGPFRHMINDWRFEPLGPNRCQVHFHVDFEFRSRALQALIGIVFNDAMQRVVRAFERRAAVLYGTSGSGSGSGAASA